MRLGSSLHDEAVVRVLERVRAEGAIEDDRATERLRAREAEVGSKVYGRERAELYGCAPISVTAEVGALLYLLARSRDARMVVEFGTSLGVSAIYLAAALRDAGVGSLVTTELLPEKARGAARNVADAGLGDLVEIRVGDALATLTRFDRTIDLLFRRRHELRRPASRPVSRLRA